MFSNLFRARLKPSSALSYAVVLAALFWLSATSNAQDATSQPQETSIETDPASLCKAVAQKRVITVTYYYDPPNAQVRVVHPYAVGYTRARKILLFGRQVKGYSKSAQSDPDKIPGWRNFRTDRIKFVAAREDSFVPIPAPSDEYGAIRNIICKVEGAFGG